MLQTRARDVLLQSIFCDSLECDINDHIDHIDQLDEQDKQDKQILGGPQSIELDQPM